MEPLAKPLRKQLEDAVVAARDTAEEAARAALMHLGVGEASLPRHLTEAERPLRRRLRAHGRQLGDKFLPSPSGRGAGGEGRSGQQAIDKLVQETAYEHWHRMLFARFLAENGLLMHPDGVPLTLAECDELARDEGAADGWELAGRYASRMLPQIFRPDSPVLALKLAPEHQRALEKLLAGLHPDTFQASDSLGWVYQFWQTKRKDQVNRSEVKIGADELPAVTQLFTEPCMVAFLLDNSLGAWWATRRLSEDDLRTAESEDELRRKAAIPGVPLEYLRFVRTPAASPSNAISASTVVRASSPEESNVARASNPGDPDQDGPGQDGLTTPPGLDESTLKKSHGEHLPHWTCDSAVYHVVFRLADSIPRAKLDEWAAERDAPEQAARRQGRDPTDAECSQAKDRYRERIEGYLDAGHGACHLARPEIAEIVASALKHFEHARYQLHAWCVMPNHVHVIVEPLDDHPLSKIIHSWKSFTANAINRKLNHSGTLWQEDSYNHIIRNEDEYGFQVRYVWQNPEKAGMPDWPWRDHTARAFSVVRATSPDLSGQDGLTTVAAWTPAAGIFDAWPEHLGELKVMDPCCGSGHFLVAAFQMLVPIRMALESLSAQEAVDAVLRDNLHGLELDQRCVELAAFALALTAWRWPEAGGHRTLPILNLACSGLAINAPKRDWLRLAEGDVHLEHALERLYELFKDAPTLGSLIDPRRVFSGDLLDVGWERVAPLVERALASEDEQQRELGVVARGLVMAAQQLANRYHLVITNVPYLARAKQGDVLRVYVETHYPDAKNELATAFLDRCLELCDAGGNSSVVLPQNWLFLTSYRKFRERQLKSFRWNVVVRLGFAAFDVMDWWAFNTILINVTKTSVADTHKLCGLDLSENKGPESKSLLAKESHLIPVSQLSQINNPDARIVFEERDELKLLSQYANGLQGISPADVGHDGRCFWEIPALTDEWHLWQSTFDDTVFFFGKELILWWGADLRQAVDDGIAYLRGSEAWDKPGIVIRQMRHLPAAIYSGEKFDTNCAVVSPHDQSNLLPIWCFCYSPRFHEEVRQIDQKVNVTNATLVKVPFDLAYWENVADRDYPNGLPRPYSNDPTQWVFHCHPCGSVVWDEETKWTAIGPKRTDATVLQTSVARLLGYRWPAESCVVRASSPDSSGQDGLTTQPLPQRRPQLELSDESRALVAEARKLDAFSDDDGICCLPAIRGKAAAHERLLRLLEAAYGDDWTAGTLSKLLAESGAPGKSLDVWLRDSFFEQHCRLFHHRPFIWHIWDGLKDGFAALVNYHKLDRANLERLIYTYLGDWIRMQERASADGAQGADERLAAAKSLKAKLEAILEGEAPLDIFVRWKPIEQQPIGWEPDLNDGVRLNIRPFMLAGDVGKKGAGVLRAKPNIDWKKDRGKDVQTAPWYHLFKGDRINDHHLTLAEKRAARDKS